MTLNTSAAKGSSGSKRSQNKRDTKCSQNGKKNKQTTESGQGGMNKKTTTHHMDAKTITTK